MIKAIRRTLTHFGELTAILPRSPSSCCTLGFGSHLNGPHGLAWVCHASTLCMTLFIQRAEHRDTQALQAKRDELLRVNDDARNSLTTLDRKGSRRKSNAACARKASKYVSPRKDLCRWTRRFFVLNIGRERGGNQEDCQFFLWGAGKSLGLFRAAMSLFDQFQELQITLPLHLVALFSPLSQPANVLGNLLNQLSHVCLVF